MEILSTSSILIIKAKYSKGATFTILKISNLLKKQENSFFLRTAVKLIIINICKIDVFIIFFNTYSGKHI